MHPSAHSDSFTRDNLPAENEWPELTFDLPELRYPPQLNCAVELVDRQIQSGNRDRVAIRGADSTWTYRDLLEKVNRIANFLVNDIGVAPGNRVLLRYPNSPLFAACYLAVLKCGAVAVPTMPLLRESELSVIATKAHAQFGICDSRLIDEVRNLPLEQLITSDEILEGMETASTAYAAVETSSDDVALIAFTSGTTGKPKGCMHFHRDVMSMCHTVSANVLKPTPDDVFIGSPPLAFTFGLGGLLAFPLHAGASTILLEAAPPPVLAEAIQSMGATISFTAPTAYKVLLSDEHVGKVSGLRIAVSAGEHLPKPVYLEWMEKTGVPMIDGLGATEMIHIFLSTTGCNDKPGSTGVPTAGYEVRVVDDDLNQLPAGEEGLLAVRGPTGCKYLDDPRQRDYVKGGWNLTGDVFKCDEDGHYWYVARGDDMIISSGYNISGPEVEEALLGHGAVAECAVVAARDADRGHVPKAFVVLSEGQRVSDELTKELQDFVKQAIAPFKYPREVEYIDALPKTQTGKIQRYALRSK
ncbi:MAG: AMP-binding protein [Woeseiaceae bacterium]